MSTQAPWLSGTRSGRSAVGVGSSPKSSSESCTATLIRTCYRNNQMPVRMKPGLAWSRWLKGVEDLNSGLLEILHVAGDHRHAVHPRGRGDERVDHRQGPPLRPAPPRGGNGERHRENPVVEPGLQFPQPALKRRRLLPVPLGANALDPLLDLAQRQ